jgi:D-methionine transport system ATP-binding protein
MAADASHGRVLRLAFAGDEGGRPLLSDVIRRFGVDLNLLHGTIDEIQGRPFGSLSVFARGAREQVAGAVEALRSGGVRVQELPHV